MKNLKRVVYIFLIVVVIVLSFIVYSSIAKEANTDIRDKTLSEIQYFESKLIYMFNALNNIEFENYKISIQDISENSKSSSKSSSSAGSSNNDSSESGATDTNSGSSSSSSESTNGNSLNNTKKFSLNMQGVLNSDQTINWDYIKNEAETLQNSISLMTLDLYEISLNNNDIINFSKEYDNLLLQIKDENKVNTLKQLSVVYSYIPKFIKNCNVDEQYEVIINTKQNVFSAYSILDTENWDLMGKHLQTANDSFSRLLTNANLKSKNKNQYMINKCYIALNELQNSLDKKDKEIFLIKYRNLLEDLNNI